MKSLLLLPLLFAAAAPAQWQVQNSQTTADLHAVDAVDATAAWVAGSGGTILRTRDAGRTWQPCTPPPGTESTDFRGIQAFTATTAIVLSATQLYKTTDSCRTWTKIFDNPNPAAAFVALHRVSAFELYLLADPAPGQPTIPVFYSADAGRTWAPDAHPGLSLPSGTGPVHPAGLSNVGFIVAFGTAGAQATVSTLTPVCTGTPTACNMAWLARPTPLAQTGSQAAGVTAVSGRTIMIRSTATITGIGTMPGTVLIAVGGNPDKPSQNNASAAFSEDSGNTWRLAATLPSGYRTAVAFDGPRDRFIAVGPNGTDITVDDGNDWIPATPAPGADPDSTRNWTALSLPFVVGPHGHIGILAATLQPQN